MRNLVAEGLRAQPPPEVPEHVRTQARNLLLRLGWRKEDVLRFLMDFTVPWDNNQAERDLRMIKLQQQKTSAQACSLLPGRPCALVQSVLSTVGRGNAPKR
jgi:transposase